MNNCHSIWLPTLTERLELINNLSKSLALDVPITIFHAIDGTKHIEEFKYFKHVRSTEKINAGMIGCVWSHLELLKNTKSDITIFEDDCTFHGNREELQSFINNAPEFDILCLGVSEDVETQVETGEYNRIFRFWGTHALIVKQSAAQKIVSTFEKYASQQKFLPADWLYSYAIQEHNLKAYVPKKINRFFDYKRGIYSVVANRIRY